MSTRQSKFNLSSSDFFYQDTSVPIIEDILDLVKHANSPAVKSFLYQWTYPIDPEVWLELWQDEGMATYNVVVRIASEDFESHHPGWNIDGESGFDENSSAVIEVAIALRPDLFGNAEIVDALEGDLYNVIPHEIHHLTQENQPFQRPSCPINLPKASESSYDYFISGCEIPAFLIGFRGEAFKKGKNVSDLIDSYLLNQVRVGKISTGDAEKIKSKWLQHSSWEKVSTSESLVRRYVRSILTQ